MSGSGAENAASRTGTLGRQDDECGAAEGADRVGGPGNGGELLFQGWVFRCAQEMNKREDGSDGCTSANHPTKDEHIRGKRGSPKECGQEQKNDQTSPFESTTCPWVHVRLFPTVCTTPAFVEAERHKRNPEEMPGIESTDLDGTVRQCAGEAVVTTKSNALRAKSVDSVKKDDEGGSRG